MLFIAVLPLFVGMSGVFVTHRRDTAEQPSRDDHHLVVVLDSLAEQLSRLERALGVAERPSPDDVTLQARYATLRARTEALASRGEEALARIPTISPVPRGVVTSPYTDRRFHPIRKTVLPHYGLDIAAPRGTRFVATANGTVVAIAETPVYGKVVDVDHANGFITRYAHADSIFVQVGQEVRRGEPLGLVGSTGLTTGPHLHYEIFKDGWSIDPFPLLLLDGNLDVAHED